MTREENYNPYAYTKQYMPNILRVDKDKLEHYNFIETVDVGGGHAHILSGGGDYFLCFSKNDEISTEERLMEPLGFRRRSIDDIKALADMFYKNYHTEHKRVYVSRNRYKPQTVTEPQRLDQTILWHERMVGRYIVNLSTGKCVHLGNTEKHDICKMLNITSHALTVISFDGKEKMGWCGLLPRMDKVEWKDYFLAKGIDFIDPREHPEAAIQF